VLDLMMSGEDGLVLCRELRAGKFRSVPVLMLTARDEEADRIVGLEMGADALFDSLICDYVDAGQAVTLQGRFDMAVVTRPQALRRILGNLVDNALKFGGAAEITIATGHDGQATVCVLDRARAYRVSRWKRCSSRSIGWRRRVTGIPAAPVLVLPLHGNSRLRWTRPLHCTIASTAALEAQLTLRKLV
jgi:CheY-like chemotaxis protein